MYAASAEKNGTGAISSSGRVSRRYVGRTYAQAPQIDAATHVVSRHRLLPGEVVRCRVTDTRGYDLMARPVADLEHRLALPVVRPGGCA